MTHPPDVTCGRRPTALPRANADPMTEHEQPGALAARRALGEDQR